MKEEQRRTLFKPKEERDKDKLCTYINPETGEQCGAYRWSESGEFCIFHAKDTYRKLNIIQAIENPKIFGNYFGEDQESLEGWKAILAGTFNLELSGDRLKLFKKLTNRGYRPKRQVSQLWVIAGRRSYKSTICSALGIYLCLFKEYPQLKKGEKGHVVVVGPNRENAKVIMDYCKGILESSPKLSKKVKRYLKESIEFENGMVIDVRTSNIVSGRGITAVAIIMEEANFFPKDNSSSPDVEVMSSLVPCTATIPDALVIGISSAYSRSGLMYGKWQKYYGENSDDVLVVQAKSTDLNPLLSQEFIDAQLAEDYERNRAEYLSEWRQDISQFINDEIIINSTIPNRTNLPPVEGVSYKFYTDGASGSKSGGDSFTLCCAYEDKKTKKIIISGIWEYRPSFSPASVIEEYSKIIKQYGCSQVVGDRWSPGTFSDLWRQQGIHYETNELSTSDTYMESLTFLSAGQVELLDHQRSLNQLRSLERFVRKSAKDHIDHRQGSHDDLATAILGCVYIIGKGLYSGLDSMPLPEKIDSKRNEALSLASKMQNEEKQFQTLVRAGVLDK